MVFKGDKEFELVDKLKHENKKLKRELKAARKLLDRYSVAEKIGLFDGEKILPSKKKKEKNEQFEKWECFTCNSGILELVFFGNRYLRICNNCKKRTKSQEIHDDLIGVLPNGKIYK